MLYTLPYLPFFNITSSPSYSPKFILFEPTLLVSIISFNVYSPFLIYSYLYFFTLLNDVSSPFSYLITGPYLPII